MGLRDQLRNIMESETSWNVSEMSIEDFIDGMLEGELLDEFNAELDENTDLMAEVALRENINRAVAESDIQKLRAGLNQAKDEAEKHEVKSFKLPRFEIGTTRFWRNSAAMIVVLVGLAGILNNGLNSPDDSYNKFYQSPTWASERSVSEGVDLTKEARIYFQGNEWQKTIDYFKSNTVPEEQVFVPHFYTGLSYQNLNDFENAIKEYSEVIKHGDNLFVEEAEWYRSLCYLKLNNNEEAKKELVAVIERKGHYEKDAKAIIRRLKYSFK
jgi:tetratricopeptide (TPR) repeat protein